jgi:hypothetical protein
MSHVQSVLFPRTDFTIPKAVKWLQDHNYVSYSIDTKPNFFRFRQFYPVPGGRYRTRVLPNGIELVLLY